MTGAPLRFLSLRVSSSFVLGPFEKNFRQCRIGRQVMTLSAHQKEIGWFVSPSKGSRDDVTSLERNSIPTIKYLTPGRI
jgi:hypothetical protein